MQISYTTASAVKFGRFANADEAKMVKELLTANGFDASLARDELIEIKGPEKPGFLDAMSDALQKLVNQEEVKKSVKPGQAKPYEAVHLIQYKTAEEADKALEKLPQVSQKIGGFVSGAFHILGKFLEAPELQDKIKFKVNSADKNRLELTIGDSHVTNVRISPTQVLGVAVSA